MLDIEEAQEFIANELKKQLQHLIGEPYDPDKIRQTVLATITPLFKSLGVNPQEVENKALSEILVVSFLGMPKDFDPKALLAQVSDRTLELLAERIGQCAFPGNLFALEWFKRQGSIVDWEFKRDSAEAACISFTPKRPLECVVGTYIIDPEEKN
jgi:hypothetical protein